MSFTALFLAHSPDADPEVHRTTIETGLTAPAKGMEEAGWFQAGPR
jgi:hypothetical protein